MPKATAPTRNETDIRRLLLQYFYDRNRKATSARSDKGGVAAKISVVYRDLKQQHGLARQEVRRNLTYLISQGWVEEEQIIKNVPLRTGTVIPQSTSYYKITAPGIDKIEGEGEFTMPRFNGIKIEATGQNIITVGDGNQVDARYGAIANALAELKMAFKASTTLSEADKLSVVSDIETVQVQLAKPNPERSVIALMWSAILKAGAVAGLVEHTTRIGKLLAPLLS